MRRKFLTPAYLQKLLGDGVVISVPQPKPRPNNECKNPEIAALDDQIAEIFSLGFKEQSENSDD